MDVTTKLSIHKNFVEGLDSTNPDFIEYKKYLLELITNIEKKHFSIQELKCFYVKELDTVIKDVWCVGKKMSLVDKTIKTIIDPIKCFETELTFTSWGPQFHALNIVCTKLAFEISINDNLKPFSSQLFNLMSLYTHICTSLSDLTRFDRETETFLNVLNDKINNL